ncbi:MAG: DMT family transporter [Candidatus Zixiibacteriota bacterium]
MNQQRTGDLYALSCAVICGLGNITAKAGLEFLTTELFNFYMFLFAFVISSFSLINREQRREIFDLNFRSFGLIFFLTLLFTSGIYFSLAALKMIEPATASFLSRMEVVVLVILAYIFLKERLTKLEILGGVIALGGVFVLKYQTTLVISKAATLMIISACFFAAAEILAKKNIDKIGIFRFIFYRNLITTFLMLFLLWGKNQTIYLPPGNILTMTLLTAIFFPVLGRYTYLQAMKRIDISRAAFVTQSTPLFTALFAFMILQSLPTATEWLGGAIIIVGVIIVKLSKQKK